MSDGACSKRLLGPERPGVGKILLLCGGRDLAEETNRFLLLLERRTRCASRGVRPRLKNLFRARNIQRSIVDLVPLGIMRRSINALVLLGIMQGSTTDLVPLGTSCSVGAIQS